ncbi:MAG: CAP domain-containing protein, partial [Pyrinomonadaceae bacterium]
MSAAAFGQSLPGVPVSNLHAATSFAGLVRPRTAIVLPSSKVLPAAVVSAERRSFELINLKRAAAGLSPLDWNDDLASLARTHSDDMAVVKFFSHKGSDGSMIDVRADKHGLGEWSAIGENIAFVQGYLEPVEFAVERWMESPGHKNNLLGTRWKESAIGVAITEDGRYYFTQVFLLR